MAQTRVITLVLEQDLYFDEEAHSGFRFRVTDTGEAEGRTEVGVVVNGSRIWVRVEAVMSLDPDTALSKRIIEDAKKGPFIPLVSTTEDDDVDF